MKDSHVFPRFDPGFDDNNNNNNEYDLHIDFTQFLEEAKKYAKEKKLHYPIEKKQTNKKQVLIHQQEKKGKKKSWKTAFFSFWKSSQKNNKANNKQQHYTDYNATNSKQRCCYSGPVQGIQTAAISGRKWGRALVSGPLMSVVNQKNEIPYVSLEKLKEAKYGDAKTYGPVYLVS